MGQLVPVAKDMPANADHVLGGIMAIGRPYVLTSSESYSYIE